MSNHDIGLMAHLMRRAGFGAPREELEARAARGYEATVEELIRARAENRQVQPKHRRVSPKLIVRDSTCSAPRS